MMKKGLMDQNILIKANDIVWVPPRHVKYTPGLSDIFLPFSFMNMLGVRPFF